MLINYCLLSGFVNFFLLNNYLLQTFFFFGFLKIFLFNLIRNGFVEDVFEQSQKPNPLYEMLQ